MAMALSAFTFRLPVQPTAACPRSSSTSSSATPACLWSSPRETSGASGGGVVAVKAGKGNRETMDFFLDDDDDGAAEDTIPDHFPSMEDWMRNRPAGFGVGKEYDLALEEKLLAEIEADKKAQEAAKLRAKAGKGKATPKAKPKLTEAPAGVEVWVGNLPRKRKVERDLRAVFRNAAGLLHIRPIVEPENEKTREPMCRGFAFFTFATEDDAYDFVSRYSGEKVKFGKVEKKIACEVAKSDSPWHPKPNSDRSAVSVPKLQVRATSFAAAEPEAPATPTKKLGRELETVPRTSSVTSFVETSSVEEESQDDLKVSETELRAMEEEIWDQFENEDDVALDLELAEESYTEDGDGDAQTESTRIRSAVDEDEDEDEDEDDGEFSEPSESIRGLTSDEVVGEKPGKKGRESSREDDVDEEDYSVEKIKELEAKLREMERKLQISAQNEEESLEMLEKRLLNKARAGTGANSSSKKDGEKKKLAAAKKKKSQAAKKSQKPKIGTLGSASRLKAKERAILTGVMSKYVSSSP